MNSIQKLITLVFVSFLVLSCKDSVSSEQEEHLESVAIALEDHSTGEYVAILYDESQLPDSVSQNKVLLKVDEEADYHVISLCLENTILTECEFVGHDTHEDHEDHEDHEEESATTGFALKASVKDTTLVNLHVDEEGFEVELQALQVGKTSLDVEIWHGSHADTKGKTFEIVVEE